MSYPFIVRQPSIPGRIILLRGRSLPYQGTTWTQANRVEVSWLPGNPVGVAQIIGPTHEPTTITGKWKDRFLDDPGRVPDTESYPNAASLVNFPKLTPFALPSATERGGNTFVSGGAAMPISQRAQRARVLRDAFSMLLLEGQLLEVSWGSIVRFGYLTRVSFPHDREEDIEYEIEFTWIGDTDSQPKPNKKPKIDPLSLLQKLFKLLSDLLNKILGALLEAARQFQKFTQAIRKIGSLVRALGDILQRLADFAFFPSNMIGEMRGLIATIRLETGDLLRQLRSLPAAYDASLSPIGKNSATAIQQAIARAAKQLGAGAAEMDLELSELTKPDIIGTVVAKADTSLRDIAREFYGDPQLWTVIADYNGFASSVVSTGTVVYVPVLQDQPSASGPSATGEAP